MLTHCTIATMSSPTNPIASASWAFLPDEEWLESRYNHEQKSYSLVGDQLAENLKDLAIQDIQPRVAQRLREVEKDCIGDYIRTWLSNRPRARRSAASDGANSTDYAALVESVDYLVQKIASPSGRESPDPVAPLFNDTKSLRGFLNLMVIEESSSKNSDDSSQVRPTHFFMYTDGNLQLQLQALIELECPLGWTCTLHDSCQLQIYN